MKFSSCYDMLLCSYQHIEWWNGFFRRIFADHGRRQHDRLSRNRRQFDGLCQRRSFADQCRMDQESLSMDRLEIGLHGTEMAATLRPAVSHPAERSATAQVPIRSRDWSLWKIGPEAHHRTGIALYPLYFLQISSEFVSILLLFQLITKWLIID